MQLIQLFSLLIVLLVGIAHAGTMSNCSTNYITVATTPIRNFLAGFGECSLSTSYATTGDVFPGIGTIGENAAYVLCGDPNYHILSAMLSSNALLGYYDSTNFSFHGFYPTNVASAFAPTTATFTGTGAVLTGTNSAPLLNTTTDAVPDEVLSIKTGALSTISGIDGVTGIQPPTLTMNSYTPAGAISVDPVALPTVKATATELTAASNNSATGFRFISFCTNN